ncbi:MAG: peptidoglycan-binding protein [Thainema sp.]
MAAITVGLNRKAMIVLPKNRHQNPDATSAVAIRDRIFLVSAKFVSVAATVMLISVCGGSAIAALQLEDSGADVEHLQRQLQAAGFYSGSITGYFGPQTQAAVEQFQAAYSLAVDGIAGNQTLEILSAAVSEAEAGRDLSQTGGLAQGSQGPSVAELQTLLREAGIYNGSITGFYGEETDAAVRQFQASAGLGVDGIAGQQTLTALRSTSSNPASTEPPSLNPGLDADQVRRLQEDLASLGYYAGAVDGVYGPQTEAAVREFQAAYELTVDGIAGSNTRATLEQHTETASASTPAPITPEFTEPGPAVSTSPSPAVSTAPTFSLPSTNVPVPVTPIPVHAEPLAEPVTPIPVQATSPGQTVMPQVAPGSIELPPADLVPTAPGLINQDSPYSTQILQQRLQQMQINSGQSDAATEDAIRQVQQQYGVSPNDIQN